MVDSSGDLVHFQNGEKIGGKSMILSGKEIAKQVGLRNIQISDFDEKRVNPNSYNLRLDNEIWVYDEDVLDMKKNNYFVRMRIPEEGLVLKPNVLYLGKTMEFTKTDKYVPMLEGRSSVGRLGVNIHATAGFGDIGFAGHWTLEISCIQPVRIYAGVEIAQIYYMPILGEFDLYGGKGAKYQNQHGIEPSLMFRELGIGWRDEKDGGVV